MANQYPSTPMYGGYAPTSYYPPQIQNIPPLAVRTPPGISQPNIQQLPASAAFYNPSRFEANSQILLPNPFPQLPPAAFTPELFRQFAVSNLPPPPPPPSIHPPPIPNLGFSQFPPAPSTPDNFNHVPHVVTYDGHSSTEAKPVEYSQRFMQLAGNERTATNARTGEGLDSGSEEGELSDGEIEGSAMLSANQSSRTISQEGPTSHIKTGSKNRLSDQSGHNLVRPTPASASYLARNPTVPGNLIPGNVLTHPTNIDTAVVLSDGEESSSSYNPPSASTPDFEQDLVQDFRTPNTAVGKDKLNMQTSKGATIPSLSYPGRSALQLRELAKGALLSLAPHNIKYPELLREGIDSQLLEQLYKELGIKDGRKSVSSAEIQIHEKLKRPVSRLEGNQMKDDSPRTQTGLDQVTQSIISHNTGAPSGIASKSPDLPTSINDQKPQGLALNGAKPDMTMQPVINPFLERKDRIAQLLAAKTGKLPTNRITPESPSPTLAAKPAATPTLPTPSKNNSRSTAPVPVEAHVNPLPSAQSPSQDQKLAKSKAQTELVRQRMESLKREGLAKAQTQSQASMTAEASAILTASKSDADRTALGTDTVEHHRLNTFAIHHEGRVPSTTRAPSASLSTAFITDTALIDQPYLSLIPGLFMTAEEPHVNEASDPTFLGSRRTTGSVEAQSAETSLSESFSIPQSEDESLSGQKFPLQLPESIVKADTVRTRQGQKRPLASDSFDEIVPPLAKRPFTGDEPMDSTEIEAQTTNEESHDVSDGEIMEVDDDYQASVSRKTTTESHKTFVEPIKSQISTSSLDPAGAGETPTSASKQMSLKTTGEAQNTSKSIPKDELWRAKNQEIEIMRKRIAEMEQRQKLKRSQSQAESPQLSSPSTPILNKSTSGQQILNSAVAPVASPTEVTKGDAAFTNFPRASPSSLNDPKFASDSMAARAATLKAEFFRQKLLRRKVLQDGLPDLDAEVQRTQSRLAETQAKLAQMRAESERREAESRAALQREQEILEEALRLEQQLQQGLSGRMQLSEELQSLNVDSQIVSDDNSVRLSSAERDLSETKSQDCSIHSGAENEAPASTQLDSKDATASDASANGTASPMSALVSQLPGTGYKADAEGASESSTSFVNGLPSKSDILPINQAEDDVMISEAESDASRLVVPAMRLPASGSTEFNSFTSRNEVGLEDNGFGLSPHSDEHDESSMDLDESSDGSVSMSDSGSDDYEPAQPETRQVFPADDESDEYEPDEPPISVTMPSNEDDEDQDDYEPAETVDIIEHGPTPVDQLTSVVPVISASGTSTRVDGIESGLQLTEAETLTKPQELPKLVEDSVISEVDLVPSLPSSHFRQYHSPLTSLKSFRFNSNFNEQVKQGYRSLTYSHNIDSKRPICPTELAGEVCTDPTCEEQHFEQMSLADSKILEQLASAPDVSDKTQRDRFLVGLKQVIADLRVRGVKEFIEVADELAAYRRRFREQEDPALITSSPP